MSEQPQPHGLAIACLVLGLCSFIAGFITGIPAIICGHIARSQIENDPSYSGSGMALAGLILGYLSVILPVLFFIAMILLVSGAAVSPFIYELF